jgi:hypothetical protein
MAEIAAGLAPYANYMVASEEIEPGGGWDYATFLNYINNNPNANGAAIGKIIVDSFIAKCEVSVPNMSATLSVIDMSKINALVVSINNLAVSLQSYATASVNNWINVAYARFSALDFSTYNLPLTNNSNYDYVDLIQFAGKIANIDKSLTAVAEQVVSAAQSAVVYSNSSKNGVYGALGLSMYFPSIMPECNATAYADNTSLNGTALFATNYSGTNGFISSYYNFYKNNDINSTIADPKQSGSATIWSVKGNIVTATLFLGDSIGNFYATQVDGFVNNTIEFNTSNSSQLNGWTALNGMPVLLFASPNINQITQNNEYLIPVSTIIDNSITSGYLAVQSNINGKLYVTGFLSSLTSKNQPLQLNQQFAIQYYKNGAGFLNTSNVVKITNPSNTVLGVSSFENFTTKLNTVYPNVTDITGANVWGTGQTFR